MSRRPEFSLTQLLYFVTIAETGNISEAAERLYASQSAVSTAIQRLERQLDNQLLVRHHAKGVSLTSAGKLLLKDAQAILQQAYALNRHSSRLQGESAECLDVASYNMITSCLMPGVISRVADSDPRLTVNVHDVHSPLDLLVNGTCELAVTYSITSSEKTVFTGLVEPTLYALTAQDHPLADSKRVRLADLARYPLLMSDSPSFVDIRVYVEKAFEKANISMPKVIYATGLEAMRALTGAGLGFMLTYAKPPSGDAPDGSRTALVTITDDLPPLSIGVQMLRSAEPTQRARNFVTALRMTAQQIYTPTATV
ncbi:LysR family transcriptional regulator [Streptomyces sp. SID12501]|uniref:LysR family transcriptional regulator n=1 Tax=Streptomyces sp. SID12501 TaxID=2706042 RepID=A0A6B3BSV9_9ACTN|nr:LysR family transcriptional regulator [Streptomyces sp. SID12501]NEC87418.1 LysR family transcriptional regulator [Streptomyces sp. SID12501]